MFKKTAQFYREHIFECFLLLWLFENFSNAYGFAKFDLNSLWTGVTIWIGYLGKYWIKSRYNTDAGIDPEK